MKKITMEIIKVSLVIILLVFNLVMGFKLTREVLKQDLIDSRKEAKALYESYTPNSAYLVVQNRESITGNLAGHSKYKLTDYIKEKGLDRREKVYEIRLDGDTDTVFNIIKNKFRGAKYEKLLKQNRLLASLGLKRSNNGRSNYILSTEQVKELENKYTMEEVKNMFKDCNYTFKISTGYDVIANNLYTITNSDKDIEVYMMDYKIEKDGNKFTLETGDKSGILIHKLWTDEYIECDDCTFNVIIPEK